MTVEEFHWECIRGAREAQGRVGFSPGNVLYRDLVEEKAPSSACQSHVRQRVTSVKFS